MESDPSLLESITAINAAGDGYYPIGKLQAHKQNVLHMAISIFIFKEQRLLLQKRADCKYHSAGLWANTVCSHPRWNESSEDCANRRLLEELGWSTRLKHFGQITYSARVGDLFENEQVQCYYGHIRNEVDLGNFNRKEVSEIQWLSISEIKDQIQSTPEVFSEWFKIYISDYHKMIETLV